MIDSSHYNRLKEFVAADSDKNGIKFYAISLLNMDDFFTFKSVTVSSSCYEHSLSYKLFKLNGVKLAQIELPDEVVVEYVCIGKQKNKVPDKVKSFVCRIKKRIKEKQPIRDTTMNKYIMYMIDYYGKSPDIKKVLQMIKHSDLIKYIRINAVCANMNYVGQLLEYTYTE